MYVAHCCKNFIIQVTVVIYKVGLINTRYYYLLQAISVRTVFYCELAYVIRAVIAYVRVQEVYFASSQNIIRLQYCKYEVVINRVTTKSEFLLTKVS